MSGKRKKVYTVAISNSHGSELDAVSLSIPATKDLRLSDVLSALQSHNGDWTLAHDDVITVKDVD